MAKKKADPVREYLAEIGRKGGEAKVTKGFGSLTKAKRKANAKAAAEKRWGKGGKK